MTLSKLFMKKLERMGSVTFWYISSVWLMLSIALKTAGRLKQPWNNIANTWWMPVLLIVLRIACLWRASQQSMRTKDTLLGAAGDGK
jgi:hypothetical protein